MANAPMPAFGLLGGLRVVFCGISVAAPFAAELYAEQGADVIWIENPAVVDSGRVSRRGGSWQQDRRNMRSLSMNYRKGAGREAFLKLLSTADVFIEASVGGGMVTVVCTGGQDIVKVTIDPQAVDPRDVGMLEDLVLSAITEAMKKSREMMEQEMSAITGGVKIPGLF